MALSSIKVLLLNVNREGWHSGNMIYDMQAINYACDTINYGPGWPEYTTTSLPEIITKLYGKGKPDIIYSYFTPNEAVNPVYQQQYKIHDSLMRFPTDFNKFKGSLKIFALSDFWARSRNRFSNDLADADFTHCFCCFAPPYAGNDFWDFFDDNIRKKIKFIGYPRCIDSECYKDYGLPKEYDVVTVGAMWHFYPLRVHIHRYLSAHSTKLGIKYKNYPHCGSNFTHSNFVRDNYAKAIHQAKILASCGGRYHLAMNKIFEAMGCNTLYMGEKPFGSEELHLQDGFNYVAVDQNNFIEKIKYYLDHDNELKTISQNGRETFLKYHTIEKRAEDFVKLVKDLI